MERNVRILTRPRLNASLNPYKTGSPFFVGVVAAQMCPVKGVAFDYVCFAVRA